MAEYQSALECEGTENLPVFLSLTEREEEETADTYLLAYKSSYKYTIPGFSVLNVQLRHSRLQKILPDGSIEVTDCLVNEHIITEIHPPTGIKIISSCHIQVR